MFYLLVTENAEGVAPLDQILTCLTKTGWRAETVSAQSFFWGYVLVKEKFTSSRLPNTSSVFSEKRLSALVSLHVHGHGQDVWRWED